jgi:hypothetical protein
MTRPWLFIGVGILILTIVDGAYSVVLSFYLPHEEHSPQGPIFSILVEGFDTFISIIEKYEKSLIVLSTIAIAAFTGTLWRATTKLQDAAERQIEDTQKALDIGRQSADAAEKAASVAERSLTALERPYIFVSDVTELIVMNGVPFVNYSVANFGKLPATIQNVCAAISATTEGFPEVPLRVSDTDPLLLIPVVAAGEKREKLFFDEGPNDIPFNTFENDTNDELFFQIVISYRGPFTKGHVSSFCWKLSVSDPNRLRLISYGGDEYNYQT